MAQPTLVAMKKQKGVVILFGIFVVVVMLAFGGLAIDIAAVAMDRSELHRATDAAALAGAGKLGFDSSVFSTARDFAVNFAANNATRFGLVTLDRNDANAAGGDVVLGVWDGAAFTPSLDGSVVNAVQCRKTQAVPTTFLGILGITSLTTGAQSIAVANPPNGPGPITCLFPVGITACAFNSGGVWTSAGCGAPVTFISSSGKTPVATTPGASNTGAWVSYTTGTPSVPDTLNLLANAYNPPLGGCPNSLAATQWIGATNGMQQVVFDNLETYFKSKYNDGSTYTITSPTLANTTYAGPGWDVTMPIIYTACPVPQAVNQNVQIATFARFVITQVINHGDCAVANSLDQNSYLLCPSPYGPAAKDPNLRAIFGYYNCGPKLDSAGTILPGPRAALGTKLRLVQ